MWNRENRGFPVSLLLEITDLVKKSSNTIFYRKQKLLQENTSLHKNREFLSHLGLVMNMMRELCKVGKWVVGKVFLIKSYACQKTGLPSLPKDYFSRLSRPVFH